MLVSRMGADQVAETLPPLLARGERAGHPVVWACDPMHGNTFVHESGYKTRHFDAVMHEVEQFFAACRRGRRVAGRRARRAHRRRRHRVPRRRRRGARRRPRAALRDASAIPGSTPARRSTSRSGSPSSCALTVTARHGERRTRASEPMDSASSRDLGPQRGPGRRDVPPVPGEPEAVSRRLARVLRRLPAPRRATGAGAAPAPRRRLPRTDARRRSARPRPPARRRRPTAPLVLDGETPSRCAARRRAIVANMEASLEVPTATSVRAVPAKLLEVNRQILNNHLARARGGKVSFTHLIGFAVRPRAAQGAGDELELRGRRRQAERRAPRARQPRARRSTWRSRDGSRTLLVPNIKQRRHARLRRVPRRVRGAHRAGSRTDKLTPDDFAGTTVSITNPGHDRHDALGAAPHARPGRDRRRRRDRSTRPSTRAPTRRRSPSSASARSSRSRAPTTTASSRAPRAASSSPRCTTCCSASDGFYDEIFAELRRAVRAGAVESPTAARSTTSSVEARERSSQCSSSSTCTACAGT